MPTITTKARKELPKKEFGLPGKRKYPMPDKAHATNAKARATQMVKKGKLSSEAKAKIDSKANKILGEKGKEKRKESKEHKKDHKEKHKTKKGKG